MSARHALEITCTRTILRFRVDSALLGHNTMRRGLGAISPPMNCKKHRRRLAFPNVTSLRATFTGKLIVYENGLNDRLQHPHAESPPSAVKLLLNCPVAQHAISGQHRRNRSPLVSYSAQNRCSGADHGRKSAAKTWLRCLFLCQAWLSLVRKTMCLPKMGRRSSQRCQ